MVRMRNGEQGEGAIDRFVSRRRQELDTLFGLKLVLLFQLHCIVIFFVTIFSEI